MTDTTPATELLAVLKTATPAQKRWMSNTIRYGPELADKLEAADALYLAWSLSVSDEEYDDRLRDGVPDTDYCLGRIITGEYPMYTPIVFSVDQCQRKPVDDGLCAVCLRRRAAEAMRMKPGPWHGIIGGPRQGWAHLFGTDWAEARNPGQIGMWGK